MNIRKMKGTDLDEVKEIYSLAFGTLVCDDLKYGYDNIYVVCNNDIIVGMCMVDYICDSFADKKGAYINSVCIKESCRRQGYAAFLLNEVEKICLKDGCSEIMLTSSVKKKPANMLYESLGYDIYDTNVFKKKIKNEF